MRARAAQNDGNVSRAWLIWEGVATGVVGFQYYWNNETEREQYKARGITPQPV